MFHLVLDQINPYDPEATLAVIVDDLVARINVAHTLRGFAFWALDKHLFYLTVPTACYIIVYGPNLNQEMCTILTNARSMPLLGGSDLKPPHAVLNRFIVLALIG